MPPVTLLLLTSEDVIANERVLTVKCSPIAFAPESPTGKSLGLFRHYLPCTSFPASRLLLIVSEPLLL